MKPINVGLLGIGTVGGGTWTVLNRNQEEITRRAGRPIRITAVADRNLELARALTGGTVKLTDDAFALVKDPDIDIIVELIGGSSPHSRNRAKSDAALTLRSAASLPGSSSMNSDKTFKVRGKGVSF